MPDALWRMLNQLPRSFVSDARWGNQARLQQIIGGGFLAVSLIPVAISVAIHEPTVMFGALGPFIAGTINLTFGLAMRRRDGDEAHFGLTDDARSLVIALTMDRMKAGPMAGPRYGPHYSRFRPVVIVPAPLEALLNEFAESYVALKEAAKGDEPNTSRHGVRAMLAADEAAAEAFNLAALAIRHPNEGHEEKIQKLIGSVREAAERLDPREAAPGTLDSLLTDLREEERARQELG